MASAAAAAFSSSSHAEGARSGVGAALAAAAEALLPPSALDRIEVFTRQAADAKVSSTFSTSTSTSTSTSSASASTSFGTELENRCLKRAARLLCLRLHPSPAPIVGHCAALR